MIWLIKYWKVAATVIIVAAISYSYLWIYNAGKSSVYNKLRTERVTILKDGKRIDEKVFMANDSALCDLLGGCGLYDKHADN